MFYSRREASNQNNVFICGKKEYLNRDRNKICQRDVSARFRLFDSLLANAGRVVDSLLALIIDITINNIYFRLFKSFEGIIDGTER